MEDTLVTGHEDMRQVVLRHINGLASMLKSHPVPIRFIVAVESNLGLEVSAIYFEVV